MNNHAPTIRRCDVAVIGGSAAGLAAALQLQRQRWSTIVLDSGSPRNAPAAHMHGYLGYDGVAQSTLVEAGREEVRRYGGEILRCEVTTVERNGDGFRIPLGSVEVIARRVVAATGALDDLPDIDGIREHWGRGVVHCPFCHGYEVRDRKLVQLVGHPMALHPAGLFAHLTDDLTLVVSTDLAGNEAELDALAASGVEVVHGDALRIVEHDGEIAGVELADGTALRAEVVVVGAPLRPRIDAFAELGLAATPHPSGIADYVETSPTGETSVPGVYGAGNVTDPSAQVLQAAADGARVGAMVAFDLASAELGGGAPAAGDPHVQEWEERYSGDQIWSGNPNGTLVAEVEALPPGRALDVGAGEGGDALWLAEQGWKVTASDVAAAGLDRLAGEAERRGVDVECVVADANELDAFGGAQYDLVSLFYPAIPRTGDNRAITNLLSAVAPGGTLLMVGHALADPDDHSRDHGHDHGHVMAWDSGGYVRIDHVEAALRASPEWRVITSETRARPPGSASHGHHVEDVVLRAERTA